MHPERVKQMLAVLDGIRKNNANETKKSLHDNIYQISCILQEIVVTIAQNN